MVGCRRYDVGFGKLQERDDHVRSHNRPSKCPERGCFYEEVGFANNQRLKQHISLCHTNPASHRFIFPGLSKSSPPTADERKRFRDAIRSENLDLVREMIHDNDYFQNRAITDGYTALQLAAIHGAVESARLLLHCGSNIGAFNKYGTALNVACNFRQLDMAQFLLSNSGREVDVDSKDRRGNTPLLSLLTARPFGARALSAVRLLLEDSRVFSDRRHSNSRTPLSLLAVVKNPDVPPMIRMLLEGDGIDPDAKDNGGRTPLSWAARDGTAGVVEAFLRHHRVDANAKDDTGWTPLAWAVTRRDSEAVPVVEVFLQHDRVDVNARDDNGWTPLVYAVERIREAAPVVKMLLEHDRTDPDAKGNQGRTPLSWAVGISAVEVVKLFLQRGSGIDVNSHDAEGRTPLAWAAARQGSEAAPLAKMLLEHDGIDVNATDNNGWTPLFMAARLGSAEVVNLLLQHGRGVDVNAKDNGGRTSLSWAAARRNSLEMPLVVRALQEHGGVYGAL